MNEGVIYLFSFGISVITSILGILLCLYLAFVKTKKIKNSDLYGAIQFQAVFLILVNLAVCFKAIYRFQDPRFHSVVNLISDPKTNHEGNKREIGSAKELIKEIKDKKKD